MDLDPALTSAGGFAALGAVFVAVNTIIIPLRFYARRQQGSAYQADDWTIIPAYVFFVAQAACTFYGIQKHYMGYPTPKDPVLVQSHNEELQKLFLAFDTFSVFTMGFTKISALFFYRRIFCVTSRTEMFGYATIISIVVISLWTVAFVILTFFLCGTHIWAMWTPSIKLQDCGMDYPILQGLSISDIILDVWVLLLPIPKIWSLHAPVKRKLAITGVFLLATVGLGASIARCAITIQLESAGQAKNFSVDPYLVNTQGLFLYVLEAGTSLVAVNLPSMWYFHSKLRLESVLRGIRSLTSLGSGASRGSSGSASKHSASKHGGSKHSAGPTAQKPRTWKYGSSFDSSSQTHLAYPEGKTVEAHVLHKMPSRPGEEGEGEGLGGVKVTRSFEQREEVV